MKTNQQSKRILLVTQYFYPENFKSNDMAFELTKLGYDVTVLTGIPNYPSGSFFKGYSIFRNRCQTIKGVKVRRAFLIPRGSGGGLRLALNYFSWAFFASWIALYLSLTKKYDSIIVHEPSPITQGIPAIIVKKIQKIPLYFWVLDLWPESLSSAGGIKNRQILNFFSNIVTYVYDNSDKILISSRSFEKSIIEKGDYNDKLIYFPNWAENTFTHKFSYPLPALPEGFIIMFAGNIGEAQDFDSVMSAALKLKDNDTVKFVFIGDGRKKKWIENFVEVNKLEKTVFLLGRHPLEAMSSFFNEADVMLLSLKNELIFNLTVPAKLQAYMAAGKPVIGMVNGEGAQIIEDAGCGFTVPAGADDKLADIIDYCSSLSKEDLQTMGENARNYCKNNFDLTICMQNLCEIIENDLQDEYINYR